MDQKIESIPNDIRKFLKHFAFKAYGQRLSNDQIFYVYAFEDRHTNVKLNDTSIPGMTLRRIAYGYREIHTPHNCL